MLLTGVWIGLMVGVVMWWVGRRGRVVDDHPVCAGCGFDLSGVLEKGAVRGEVGERCSECGKYLSGEKAVRIGNRVRRGGVMGVGVAMVLACGVVAAGMTFVVVSGMNVLPWLPTGMVLRQAERGNDAEQAAAFVELDRRVKVGRDLDGIVEGVLRLQGDWNLERRWHDGEWDGRLGDLVEETQKMGTIGKGQWERYLAGAINAVDVVRPRVAMGHGIVVVDRMLMSHVGGSPSGAYAPRFHADTTVTLRCGNQSETIKGAHAEMYSSAFYGSRVFHFPTEFTDRLGPGAKEVELEHQWVVRDLSSGKTGSGKAIQRATLTVLPAGEEDVRAVVKPELREEIEKRLKVQSLGFTTDGDVYIEVRAQEPVMDMAFEVFIRDESHEEARLLKMSFFKGRDSMWAGSGKVAWAKKGNDAEVVLRPSKEVAEETVEMTEIWGKEVRKKVTLR